MATEYPEYLDDMLYCGTNKTFGEIGWSDKLQAAIRGGDPHLELSSVRVNFGNGVEREGIPTLYLPQLDFSEGDGIHRVLFTFLDNDQREIVGFYPYQLGDTSPFYRMVGCKPSFTLNLADEGGILNRLNLPPKDFMPKGIIIAMQQAESKIYEKYIKPLMDNYSRALMELKSIHNGVILPLKRDRDRWKAEANRTQQFKGIGGLPEYKKMQDAIAGTALMPTPQIQNRSLNEML